MPSSAESPIRIAISTCLLGENVRFDGGHKRDPFLTEVLGPYVEWTPVCPEVEVGMGTPRESIQLERKGGLVQLVGTKSRTNHTSSMRRWSRKRLRELAKLGLCGYVLKKDSPSCGMERVRVYDENGVPSRTGRGLFAEELIACFGNLPVEEEGRLRDAKLRENFIECVFAYHRLQSLFGKRWSAGQVVDFHTAHKLLLMAHSPQTYRKLGPFVARIKEVPRKEFRERYETDFMQAMRTIATRRRHFNVLQHMSGYLHKHLDRDQRQELVEVLEDYRRGLVPLVVPITLIRHHVRRVSIAYLQGQVYLEPHPKELMLRNHV